MHLHQSKRKDGRVYLTLMQSYRKDGKSLKKTVKSLGYLDDLKKDFDDPVAHFKAVCIEQNALAQQERQGIPIEIHPAKKIDKKSTNRKNIGSAALMCIYNAADIERVLRNASRKKKFGFDLNAVMRLLVCERVLHPGSKLAAYETKDSYFFRSEFSEHDVYRALTELAPLKDRIISALNRHVDALGIRDGRSVYYDVTNYYFECDPDTDTDDGVGLRKYGVSKEHRPNPIVQMGLLQDKNAIPFTYKIFAGNTPDCSTMIDVLAAMKKDYGIKRVIVVADKGLNTSSNIAACIGRGDGFVYSQSIRGTKSNNNLREWVLEDKGYTHKGDDFKIKSRQDTKEITVTDVQGRTKKVGIEIKTVAFWSRKYQQRARQMRAKVIDAAQGLIQNPCAYRAHTNFGAAKYVKEINVDVATGKVLTHKLCFDEEALAKDEACDGYYCIITSEYNMADEEIIEVYKGLWCIEESFKVTKADLLTRPVYCRRPDHIEAHFLVCYVALYILRILQYKSAQRYSAKMIAKGLSLMCGSAIDTNLWAFDYRSDMTDDVCASVGLDLTKKFMQLKDIKKVLAQANR